MAKVKVIDIIDMPNKWLNLMLHLQNDPGSVVFKCSFPDKSEATRIKHRMNEVIVRRPTWFTLLVVQRDCDVYVVNVGHATEVEVRYG